VIKVTTTTPMHFKKFSYCHNIFIANDIQKTHTQEYADNYNTYTYSFSILCIEIHSLCTT